MDLDSMSFAELMDLARQHNVPGRGAARIGALREGVRAALGGAAPAAAPAGPVVPGKSAGLLSWRSAPIADAGATRYVTADGRWEIVGRRVQAAGFRGGAVDAGREFTAYDALSGVKIAHTHRRLRDAKAAVQQHVENVERAHTDARLCERARLAGDADWRNATHGQILQALAEDAHRAGEARRSGRYTPRQQSALGLMAQAYRAARESR